jgi:DNA polymerase-3 subunit beta
MKIILNTSVLLKNLQVLSGVLNSSNTMPILDNFLFEIENKNLKITASDLETTMNVNMDIDSENTESKSYAVPAKILIDLLKSLPHQPSAFTFDASNKLEITSDSGIYEIPYCDAKEYPVLQSLENPSRTTISSKILENAISKTIFATGTDDLRPVMTGVLFQLSTTSLTFVATDAHKLVKYQRTDITSSEDADFIMPKKPLNVLKTIFSTLKEDEEVEINYNISNATFSFKNCVLNCRLIDGKYPNYEGVIPKENSKKLIVDRSRLINSVSCVSIFSNKQTHQVRLKIAGNELNLSADDKDYSNKADERLTCDYEGDDIMIGFNSKFLLEMLKNLKSDEIQIEMSEPNRAGVLSPIDGLEEGETITMLVMPSLITQ